MPHLVKTAHLSASADAIWPEIGHFGAIGDWHPMLENVESEGDHQGATRTAHAADGSTQIERLQRFDGQAHVYQYEIESTPMPVRNYAGEFRVDDDGDGTSTVRWSVEFDTDQEGKDEVVDMVDGFLEAGAEALRRRYGQAAPFQ